jgi:hypothetical protein
MTEHQDVLRVYALTAEEVVEVHLVSFHATSSGADEANWSNVGMGITRASMMRVLAMETSAA